MDAPQLLPRDRWAAVREPDWGKDVLCPRCWGARGRRRWRPPQELVLLLAAYVVAYLGTRAAVPALVSTAAVAAGWYAGYLLFGAATLLVARLLGWAVVGASLGSARPLVRLGTLPYFDLRAGLGAAVFVTPRDPAYRWWQWPVVHLAGVAANTAAGAALVHSGLGAAADVAGVTVLAVGAAWFLLPAFAGEASLARRALTGVDRPDPEAVLPRLAQMCVGPLAVRGRSAEALALLDQALEQVPDEPSTRRARAAVLAEAGRLDEALAEFEALLGSPLANPADQAELDNDYAHCCALAGDTDRLAEADRRSRRAVAAIPQSGSVLNTRALVLVLTGHVVDGTAMARRLYTERILDKSGSALLLAIAAACGGNVVEARRWLAEGRQDAGDLAFLALAERTVERAAT